MANAADGYLGDWLPHRDKCRCSDCQVERLQRELASAKNVKAQLLSALKNLVNRNTAASLEDAVAAIAAAEQE